MLSAIAVPIFAKLGDMFGYKRMLLISTAITAAASWWLAMSGDFTIVPDRVGAAGRLQRLAAARGRADLRPRPPLGDRRIADPARGRIPRRRPRGRRDHRRPLRQPGLRGDRRQRHAHPVRPGDRRDAGVLRGALRRSGVGALPRPQARPRRASCCSRSGCCSSHPGSRTCDSRARCPIVVAALILRRRARLHPVRAAGAAASGSVHRPAGAASTDDVAGHRHGRALRHQRARCADPALDLREHPARTRLRTRARVRRDLVPHRRVPGVDDHRRRCCSRSCRGARRRGSP